MEIGLKYEGYIKRQQAQIDEMRRLEGKKLPEGINFLSITGLRKEAREKLQKIRPERWAGFPHFRREPGGYLCPFDLSCIRAKT